MMLTCAALFPTAVFGLKVTAIVHEAAGATVAQLFTNAKSPGFAPISDALETVRGAVPMFVTVMFCGADELPIMVGANTKSPLICAICCVAAPLTLTLELPTL